MEAATTKRPILHVSCIFLILSTMRSVRISAPERAKRRMCGRRAASPPNLSQVPEVLQESSFVPALLLLSRRAFHHRGGEFPRKRMAESISQGARPRIMTAVSRILIVDDHPVVLFGLRVLFSDDPSRIVVGEALDKAAALSATLSARPDVIILDLVLGGRDGIELMQELLAIHGRARVVVYSSQDERVFAPRVLQAGGSGYVAKSEDLSVVAKAVDAVTEGRLYFSTRVSALLLRQAARIRPADNPYEALSNRELQVFRLIGEGRSSQEIADQLQLSIKTVGTYRERLKIKLYLENNRDLERAAFSYAGTRHA